MVLASTAIQLASPGSTSGATRIGIARHAALVSATSTATSGLPRSYRQARNAYQSDQAVSTATAGSSSSGRTGGVRTASATGRQNSPQESRSSAGNRVKMNANAPAAGRSTVAGDVIGLGRAGIGKASFATNDPIRVRAAEIDAEE